MRARVDAGDRDAAGPLGELLAGQGDLHGAIKVWADTYGDRSPRTKRLAELLVQEGDPEDAVRVWEDSDAVWNNPISLYREYLASLPEEERQEYLYDITEEVAGTWIAVLSELMAHQGEEAVLTQWRAWKARPGGMRGPSRQ
jgi:hypothetical protein